MGIYKDTQNLEIRFFFFFHLSVPAPHTVHKNDGNKKRPASDQQCDDT